MATVKNDSAKPAKKEDGKNLSATKSANGKKTVQTKSEGTQAKSASGSQKSADKPVKATKAPSQTKPVATKQAAAKPAATKSPAKPVAAKKYHISQRNEDNMWQVKAEGADKALKLFKTQQEAIDYAKKVAGNQEGSIMIHKKDGSFRKLTY